MGSGGMGPKPEPEHGVKTGGPQKTSPKSPTKSPFAELLGRFRFEGQRFPAENLPFNRRLSAPPCRAKSASSALHDADTPIDDVRRRHDCEALQMFAKGVGQARVCDVAQVHEVPELCVVQLTET